MSVVYVSVFVFKFPPYATNEIGKVTGVNRRELGHGEYKFIDLHGILTKPPYIYVYYFLF